MLETRDKVKSNIHWNINSSNYLFWWDKWTPSGPINHNANINYNPGKTKVNGFLHDQNLDIELLQEIIPPQVAQEVTMVHMGNSNVRDQDIWSINAQGSFFMLLCIPTVKEEKRTHSQTSKNLEQGSTI